MSFTPLALNVIGSLYNDAVFTINPRSIDLQGTWTPTSYTHGTLLSQTILGQVSTIKRSVYDAVSASTTDVTLSTYRKLLNLGSSTIPALGNTRPDSFKPTYAGYGSWSSGTLMSTNYPPKNYPLSGAHSYIHANYGDYAWITGWPGTNAWQQPTDTYKAAYIPSSGDPITSYDEYFSHGFISTIARQAYYEMWSGQFNQYNAIVNCFQQTSAFREQQNSSIASYVNSKTFMSGVYSNINDLTTSDIAGVNQAFKIWGNDLIASGRAIYLPEISKFGIPSVLLRNLKRNNAVNDALKMALHVYSDLSITELNEIFLDTYVPTLAQERKIYSAFLLVSGDDLHSQSTGITYGINCKTLGLETLADLLNPRKLFPNSYASLTIPQYSTTTVSAKIYDFIYIGGGVNDRIADWSDYLTNILPDDLARAAAAFGMTMSQIKNISAMDIQRFSQVVTNLELTDLNLPDIESGNGLPVNIGVVNDALSRIAGGSGNSGMYRQRDFFGAASGYPYTDIYSLIVGTINTLTSVELRNLYTELSAIDLTLVGADTLLNNKIDQIEATIQTIQSTQPSLSASLNYYWSKIGTQLAIEQRAIATAITVTDNLVEQSSNLDFDNFVSSVKTYATDTTSGGAAATLESLANIQLLGGQSLVAYMRESRNAARIGLTGGELLSDIDDTLDIDAASATANVVGGAITSVTVTSNGVDYIIGSPTITIYPVGLGGSLSPVLESSLVTSPNAGDSGGDTSGVMIIEVIDGGNEYGESTYIDITSPNDRLLNPPQQTYADTPESRLVPPSLVTDDRSSPSVDSAIDTVTTCHCDCWN